MNIFSRRKPTKKNGPRLPLDFQKAFDKAGSKNKTRVKSLGMLHLPTGSIVACDGIVYGGAKPFAQKVTPGSYGVSALISNQKLASGKTDERYALVKLALSNKPAVRWTLATQESQNLNDLKKGQLFGYDVDAGVGSFMDEKTFGEYAAFEVKLREKNSDADVYNNFLMDMFRGNAENPDDPRDSGQWVNVEVPGSHPDNVIIFSSGWGDGVYGSYWGYDNEDTICCLVTDFKVLGN